MRIKNINKTIFPNGDTSDIIKVVMMAYDIENDPQIEELAHQLRGYTDIDTCRNIWQYLIDNVNYRADVGKQEIKSPARLLNDKVGDCKSYSLFTAVILRYLDIPHVFRFVSYDDKQEATHVYVVANLNDGDVVIDAVAYVQAGYPFNNELKYTFHCDMADKGTTIAYLAGLPGYGRNNAIGNPGDDSSRYQIWIGDDKEHLITAGKHFLYSHFDLTLEMLNIATTEKDKALWFDKLDIAASLLYAYNYVAGDTDKYSRIAFIVAGMVADGVFTNPETNEDVRADRLDILLKQIVDYYKGGYIPPKYDIETWNMVLNEVLPHNDPASIAGIGSFWPWDTVADKIKSGGYYFLYKYIPDKDLKNYPAIVAKKKAAQLDVHSWLSIDIFHTEKTRDNLMRAGIIARTGKTPEQYIKDYKAGNIHTVGIVLTTIATIITIITALISLVKSIFGSKSTTSTDVNASAANVSAELFTNKSKTTTGTSSSGVTVLGLSIGLGIALLYSVFKKS